jgi:hypothetical protein
MDGQRFFSNAEPLGSGRKIGLRFPLRPSHHFVWLGSDKKPQKTERLNSETLCANDR